MCGVPDHSAAVLRAIGIATRVTVVASVQACPGPDVLETVCLLCSTRIEVKCLFRLECC